ncbi:MAG: Hpt domain-containing protein [Chloroflexota bacterium]|nr:Hpt domain-containing protein [Chloroflexota bacterium]
MVEDSKSGVKGASFSPKQPSSRAIRPEWVARFKQDAEVHLAQISEGLQLLPPLLGQTITPEETESEQHDLRELFRHAHNLKGTARMIGLVEIAEAARLLEEALGQAYLEPLLFVSLQRKAVQEQVDSLMGLIQNIVTLPSSA